MGKKLYRHSDVSESKTRILGIDKLLVLKQSDSHSFHAVHERYFSDKKIPCPACGSQKTRCSKIEKRTFKDILWESPAVEGEKEPPFKIIDLIFHQRYMRCDTCGESVFPEPISFADKGCRYTVRLSDVLAKGTFRFSYKKVCEHYKVPASTASVGPIMRRQIQYREKQLAPLAPFESLGIIEVRFHSEKYAMIFTITSGDVYCIDIMRDLSEETLISYLRSFNIQNIGIVYIDPIDSIRNAVSVSIPNAKIVVTDECILRYARTAMYDASSIEGKKMFLNHRNRYLTMPRKHIESDYILKQLDEKLPNRPKLNSAYIHYQSLIELLDGDWEYKDLVDWSQSYSDEGRYFADLDDAIELFEPEIKNTNSGDKELPDTYQTAISAILSAFADMPHCTFDVLRGRCFMTVSHDSYEENKKNYRLGIHYSRLVENMNDITVNIKEAREYALER